MIKIGKKYSIILVILTSFISSISYLVYYFYNHQILAYNDATSHLNIARRVVDSLTPSIVQIGSTWLPLLHLLEIPFIWSEYLWHSGLAGSLVSMTCYVLSSYFIYSIVEQLTKSKLSGYIGSIIFLTNANMGYMQTMAMFEPLLIVNALGVVNYLTKWSYNDKLSDLLIASMFALLGSLSRYDGWFLLAGSVGYVFLVSLLKKNFVKAEGNTIIYTTLAAMGIVCWLIYNWAIFGNPLYFAKNEFSAYAQQTELASKNLLPTKQNIYNSLITYSLSVILNQGVLYSFLALVGVIIFVLDRLRDKDRSRIVGWSVMLLLIPYFFNIYALYEGHSVIWIPLIPPNINTFFNVRYGLLLVSAVSVYIGYMTRYKLLRILVLVLIPIQIVLYYPNIIMPGADTSLVLMNDTVASINNTTQDATDWLNSNYYGGLLLISSASSEAFIFNSGIDMKYFITEGTGKYWKESLVEPNRHASYVIFFPSFTDRVGKMMKENSDIQTNYSLVFSNETYLIYRRNSDIDGKNELVSFPRVERTFATQINYPYEFELMEKYIFSKK